MGPSVAPLDTSHTKDENIHSSSVPNSAKLDAATCRPQQKQRASSGLFTQRNITRGYAREQAAEAPRSPKGDLHVFCVEGQQLDTSGDPLPYKAPAPANKPAVTEGRLSLSAWARSCLDRARSAVLSLFLLSRYPGVSTFANLLSPVFTICVLCCIVVYFNNQRQTNTQPS